LLSLRLSFCGIFPLQEKDEGCEASYLASFGIAIITSNRFALGIIPETQVFCFNSNEKQSENQNQKENQKEYPSFRVKKQKTLSPFRVGLDKRGVSAVRNTCDVPAAASARISNTFTLHSERTETHWAKILLRQCYLSYNPPERIDKKNRYKAKKEYSVLFRSVLFRLGKMYPFTLLLIM
jgi:hypothetical protein